jgi:hypothetical protein
MRSLSVFETFEKYCVENGIVSTERFKFATGTFRS